MKIRYRLIGRRKIEAARQLHYRTERTARAHTIDPRLDEPMEMPSELIDVATGKLVGDPSGRGEGS